VRCLECNGTEGPITISSRIYFFPAVGTRRGLVGPLASVVSGRAEAVEQKAENPPKSCTSRHGNGECIHSGTVCSGTPVVNAHHREHVHRGNSSGGQIKKKKSRPVDELRRCRL
jgi:hypothetical protein